MTKNELQMLIKECIYELIENKKISKILYHASPAVFKKSILSKGIIPNPKLRLYHWCKPFVYLTDDPDLAKSFVDSGTIEMEDDDKLDYILSKGGILYHIDSSKLDLSKLQKDKNWKDEDSNSYQYSEIIPPSAFIEITKFETY